jgi:hypothetical protein
MAAVKGGDGAACKVEDDETRIEAEKVGEEKDRSCAGS